MKEKVNSFSTVKGVKSSVEWIETFETASSTSLPTGWTRTQITGARGWVIGEIFSDISEDILKIF